MITFFKVLTAQNERLAFEVVEVVSTGYDFKQFEVTISGFTSSSKALLKGVARKYEASVSEPTEGEIMVVLAVEQEDSPEEWVNTILEDLNTLYNKYN